MKPWVAVIDRQVLRRNAAEIQPTESVFNAHHITQNQLLRVQQRVRELVEENARLDEQCKSPLQYVRTLELASAGAINSAARGEELEARVEELQKQLQESITREKDYYKSLYEAKRLAEENKALQGEVSQLKEQEAQHENVLRILRNDYAALKQENNVVRPKLNTLISERDRCIKELLAAKDTMARMQDTILEYEDKLNQMRRKKREESGGPAGSMYVDPVVSNLVCKHHTPRDPTAIRRDVASALEVAVASSQAYAINQAHGDRLLYAICAADSGNLLVSAGGDRMIRHWEYSTGKLLRSHPSTDVPLCVDSSSHYLLSGCADGIARFWDMHALRTVELTGHREKVVAAYLSPSAHTAFTASSDRTIKLWDVRNGSCQRTIMCCSSCNDVCVGGSFILSAHYNGSIWVWDRRTNDHGTEIKHAHQKGVTCVRLDPSGQRCVSLGRDGSVCVRDVRDMSREFLRIEDSGLRCSTNLARLAVSPDGRLCALGNLHGAILFVSLDTGRVLEEKLLGGHTMAVHSVVWTLCDSTPMLASIGEDKRIVVWR
ncbi:Protein tipD [Trypanosoma rangeli]|uniref:Protein tipD n=1 Tax=Trypanosoma rangeli TaxID=5698 RepID=A0A422NYX2_TRYRA|nr:Protein tipD [Trypanosoma rangeli]RNF10629.1 Protein tipD [Trypanosoma rangeli]|eukprot:RNF10629.1 Protein tipD [Trypanosoma rangeli]